MMKNEHRGESFRLPVRFRVPAAVVLCATLTAAAALAQSTSFGPMPVPGTAVIFDPDNVLTAGQLASLRTAGSLSPTPAVKAAVFLPAPGQAFAFSATGSVGCCGVIAVGPDGYPADPANISSLGSISGFASPNGLPLVGVFTNGSPSGSAPATHNYSGGLGQLSFSPLLNQVFFIGDGVTGTGSGTRQVFNVPDTATELWLGFADGGTFQGPPANYGDNVGSLLVSGTLRINGTAALFGNITAKSGPSNARVWSIQVSNDGPGVAIGAQMSAISFVQTGGSPCTPSPTTAFPINAGNLAPATSSTVPATLDFSSCAANARFTITISLLANDDASSGAIVRLNQFQ